MTQIHGHARRDSGRLYGTGSTTRRSDHPSYTVPPWVQFMMERWSDEDHFGLDDWTFNVSMALMPGNNPGWDACVAVQSEIKTASFQFEVDLADTPEDHEIVLHELVHVAHGPLDDTVKSAIIPRLPPEARAIAEDVYDRAMETYINDMARMLYRLDSTTTGGES